MNLNKSLEFFDPIKLTDPIHIIGCGAIGSTVAMLLTRLGITNIHLYDFDIVMPHNIANQQYTYKCIKTEKVIALRNLMVTVNPEVQDTVILHTKGYTGIEPLRGYIFLAVDNIDLRRAIVEQHMYNLNIKAVFDFRMGLSDAQHYAANWNKKESKDKLLKTMQFTHAEAKEATPISACGTTLSVMPTVSTICSLGVANFINFVKQENLKELILVDAFAFLLDSF